MNIDVESGLSIWDIVYRDDYLPYRHGHRGYRYGIWANDMADDSVDTVILHIEMRYLVTLVGIENKHSTDDESLPAPHVTMIIHLVTSHAPSSVRVVVVVNDPPK